MKRRSEQRNRPHASRDIALNFISLTRTNPQRASKCASKCSTQQPHSAIQIDRAAKRRSDTLLFELAKHLDDTA